MKKTGRLLAAILALIMALSVMSVPVFAETYNDWEYAVMDGDTVPTAMITGYTGTDTDVEIPGRIIGDAGDAYKVTFIARGTFDGCSNIKSITIPQSVTVIEPYTFDDCTSLESFTVDPYNANFESADGVLFIKGKTELLVYPKAKAGNYTLPDCVEKIADWAFEGNKYMEILNTGTASALTEIGFGAFEECESLEVVSLADAEDLYILGEEAFACCEALQFVYLPDDINTIPRSLFYGSFYLKEFTLPSQTLYIEESAFKYVRRLDSLTIGKNVCEIDPAAFDDFSVKEFIVDNESTDFATDENGVLFDGSRKTLVRYPIGREESTYKVPGSCTAIADHAFQAATTLTSLQIPASVDDLGEGVFEECDDGLIVTCPCSSAAAKYCDACGVKTLLTHTYVVGVCTGCGDWQHTGSTVKLVSVTNASTGVLVKWQAMQNADGYIVYRKMSNTNWVKVDTVDGSTTSYTDKTAFNKSGVEFRYTVKAYRVNPNTGKTEYSKYNTGGLLIKALKMPTAKLENKSTGEVLVSWTAIAGADRYTVYRRNAGDTTWTKLGNTTACSYTDKTGVNGKQYQYTVRVYSGNYSSAFKAVTIVKLATPTTTVSNTMHGVQIKWKKSAGATGYYVYRKPAGGSYSKIATTTADGYMDKTAQAGTTYYYAVRAYKGTSTSGFVGKPIMRLKMTSVTAKNVSGGIQLSWSKAAFAKGYYVYRFSSDNTYKRIATTTSLSYVDTNVSPGYSYGYCVRPYNGSYLGSDDGASYKRLTQPRVTLSKPAANTIKVSLTKVTGAREYEIYRKAGSGSYTKIATITTLTYTDKNVKAGTKYTYSVRATYGTYYYSAYTTKSITR